MNDEHSGHRSRMRERFLNEGLTGFAPHEVLELLLFYAIPQKNVNPIAHTLIKRFGSLEAVLCASAEELCKVDGVGEYASALLRLTGEIHRTLNVEKKKFFQTLDTSSAARSHCEALLRGEKDECFYVVCMNAALQVLTDERLGNGQPGAVNVPVRTVVESVLRHNARFAILCHNHPGGILQPSGDDLESTRKIRNALRSVDVELLDHLIVTENDSLSMAARGLLKEES